MNNGDNGKKIDLNNDFKYHLSLHMNDDGGFACHTNVGSLVLGYGMLEMGKSAVEQHILRLQNKNKPKIVSGSGILNFVRGKK